MPAQWRSGSYHKTTEDTQLIQDGEGKVPGEQKKKME